MWIMRYIEPYDLKCRISYMCTISLKEITANRYILRQAQPILEIIPSLMRHYEHLESRSLTPNHCTSKTIPNDLRDMISTP